MFLYLLCLMINGETNISEVIMKFAKLLLVILSGLAFNLSGLGLPGYSLLVEQYNKIALDESSVYKVRLDNVESKLGFIKDILLNCDLDSIFSNNLNPADLATREKIHIRTYLHNQNLSLDNLKARKKYLEGEKSSLKKYEFFYKSEECLIEMLGKARKKATTVGDYASGTFMAYGIYDLLYNPLKHSLKDFCKSPKLILESKGTLVQKTGILLAMLAITCHYVGK